MKYIITDVQIKRMLSESHHGSEILTIHQLAELLSRLGPAFEYDTMVNILKDIFREGGDDAIIKSFKDSTGIDLDVFKTGQYVLKY